MDKDNVRQDHNSATKIAGELLTCLSSFAVKKTYEPLQHIIFQDSECEAAYFILEGKVQVYKLSPQGRQQTMINLEPGESFNTVPVFLAESDNPSNAVAVTPVTLLVLYKDQVNPIIKKCPGLANFLLHDFANRLSHLSNLAGELALQSVRSRLARFLLERIESSHNTRWTQEEIAANIGSVREVVSRILRDFIKQGYIRKDRHRLVIVNPQALEIEAER